jgi:hypothetical protein
MSLGERLCLNKYMPAGQSLPENSMIFRTNQLSSKQPKYKAKCTVCVAAAKLPLICKHFQTQPQLIMLSRSS